KGKTSITVSNGDPNADNDLWQWVINSNTTYLTSLGFKYVGTQNSSVEWLKLGDKQMAPGGAWEFGFPGMIIQTSAPLTVSLTTISICDNTTTSTPTKGYSSRPALKID